MTNNIFDITPLFDFENWALEPIETLQLVAVTTTFFIGWIWVMFSRLRIQIKLDKVKRQISSLTSVDTLSTPDGNASNTSKPKCNKHI